MCNNVLDTLKEDKNATFLMTFLWQKLVEKKIEDGVETHIIMDNPLFTWS